MRSCVLSIIFSYQQTFSHTTRSLRKGVGGGRFVSSKVKTQIALIISYMQEISTNYTPLTIGIILIVILYFTVISPYLQFLRYKKFLTQNYCVRVTTFQTLTKNFLKRQRDDLEKYGDSQHSVKFEYRNYQLSLGTFQRKIFLDLIDPELIRQYYEKNLQGCYIKSQNSPFLGALRSILGDGLLLSQGNEWKRKKKIMSHVFNFDFIKSKIPLILRISNQVLDNIEAEQKNKGKTQIEVDVGNMFQRIFGNVVIKCFFGDIELKDIQGESIFQFANRLFELNTQRVMSLYAQLVPYFYRLNLRPIDRKVHSMKNMFEDYASKIIAQELKKTPEIIQSKKDIHYSGVIQLLIKENKLIANDDPSREDSTRQSYTHSELIDEFKTFFMAGTDTTSNNTTILVYMLAKHPEVEKKVREEMREVIGDTLDNLDFDVLKRLTYLEKVQKEALRMYSPSAGIFLRQAVKDHYIGDIPVKKGMLVTVKIKPNHFREEFYERPEIFDPDRWTKIDQSKVDPLSYFPFSSGPRNCIGQHLALLESKIALVSLLHRYNKITLQKPEFRLYMRTLYAAEKMTTTFSK